MEEAGQVEEGGDMAVRQERKEDDVWATFSSATAMVNGWGRGAGQLDWTVDSTAEGVGETTL